MKTPRQIELAMQIVIVAFAEKIRAGKISIPTSTHSLRVGLSLLAYGYPVETCIGGFVHDIEEDTTLGKEFIRGLFGDRVAFLMHACSLDPSIADEAQAENDLFERVVVLARIEGDLDPLRIKCADSLDNLRTNSALKLEWQRGAVGRGSWWHKAACQHLTPEEVLVGELGYIANRETQRLAGTAPK